MKGQIEIVGLVVIVLLITVGGVIFFRLYSLSSDGESGIRDSNEVNNMRNALLKTTICEISVKDAIEECYNRGVLCGENACEYTKEKIQEILDASLFERDDFKLVVKVDNNLLFELGGCGREGVSASKAPIIKKGVFYDIDYKMCDRKL